MTRAVVCGAAGFLGGHLVSRLKAEGCWVRGVDRRQPDGETSADEFVVADLRDPAACGRALDVDGGCDEVYQLAAVMGGVGFLTNAGPDVIRHNELMNRHVLSAAADAGVGRYFLASSTLVYPDTDPNGPPLREEDADAAAPSGEYGAEKLAAERAALDMSGRTRIAVRIARFQNCYGPGATWRGGREMAVPALCRKAAEAPDGGAIEVWGDGTAVRSYTYVADAIDGLLVLMRSDLGAPANVGSSDATTVAELAAAIIETSGKRLSMRYVGGPVGVRARTVDYRRMTSLGWRPRWSLHDGIARTYAWVADRVREAAAASS